MKRYVITLSLLAVVTTLMLTGCQGENPVSSLIKDANMTHADQIGKNSVLYKSRVISIGVKGTMIGNEHTVGAISSLRLNGSKLDIVLDKTLLAAPAKKITKKTYIEFSSFKRSAAFSRMFDDAVRNGHGDVVVTMNDLRTATAVTETSDSYLWADGIESMVTVHQGDRLLYPNKRDLIDYYRQQIEKQTVIEGAMRQHLTERRRKNATSAVVMIAFTQVLMGTGVKPMKRMASALCFGLLITVMNMEYLVRELNFDAEDPYDIAGLKQQVDAMEADLDALVDSGDIEAYRKAVSQSQEDLSRAWAVGIAGLDRTGSTLERDSVKAFEAWWRR